MSRAAVSTPPSRREARRERELEHRRSDVLEAATEAFATHGYHDAQIGEIAARAELSLASLYSMFDGKEAWWGRARRGWADACRSTPPAGSCARVIQSAPPASPRSSS
ncbi:MAG TPA: helix-turn-helix domain-containing protein [Thermoanaerobaculia bacterium]|nr:helix-turn-helix domain-containing protein [Thermoanaerobaculia bacterium]